MASFLKFFFFAILRSSSWCLSSPSARNLSSDVTWRKKSIFHDFNSILTHRRTDGRTDGQTHVRSHLNIKVVRGHQKKLFKGHFRIILTAWNEKNFCNGLLRQGIISIFQDIWSLSKP